MGLNEEVRSERVVNTVVRDKSWRTIAALGIAIPRDIYVSQGHQVGANIIPMTGEEADMMPGV